MRRDSPSSLVSMFRCRRWRVPLFIPVIRDDMARFVIYVFIEFSSKFRAPWSQNSITEWEWSQNRLV